MQVRSIQRSVTAIYLKEYEENNLRYFQCNSFKSDSHYSTTYKELQYISTGYNIHEELKIISTYSDGGFSLNSFLGLFSFVLW